MTTPDATTPINDVTEWLEPDGRGAFASGTSSGLRTRRYHFLLACATTPPTGRLALVNGMEAWIERNEAREALSSQRYLPDIVAPDGLDRLEAFSAEPWPTWTYRLDDGGTVTHEAFVPPDTGIVVLTWRGERGTLRVRPLLSGRDIHALHHENDAFRFDAAADGDTVSWRPYDALPGVTAWSSGAYRHEPVWYRAFLYREERARGHDAVEDLGAPGVFSFDLAQGDAVLVLGADAPGRPPALGAGNIGRWLAKMRDAERKRRGAFPSRLHRAADGYLVERGDGRTIVAGYPWFTDWGRDTFIAIRGLCLAAGRLDEARKILLAWAGEVSEGMLPNRFVEQGDAPEYNTVDAALWYVVAVYDFLRAFGQSRRRLPKAERAELIEAVDAILTGHARGTRYRIGMDSDGLLAAGEPGVQLTWMDAKVGDWVVTPRIGKPVEIQALWLNALKIGQGLTKKWERDYRRGREAFAERFWHPAGYLYDVVDVDHRPGTVDATFRPNQVLAVGGLPIPIVTGTRAEAVVAAVEERLWTPLGLRSLAPNEVGYSAHYEGGVVERDRAYHQGTVWPWLSGPFVEAWVRVRGGTAEAVAEARNRFLGPLLRHLDEGGLGHVSEIADADVPYTPRGCPFQAWSVGETLRVMVQVLGESVPSREARTAGQRTASI